MLKPTIRSSHNIFSLLLSDVPDSDGAIGEPGEEPVALVVPAEGGALLSHGASALLDLSSCFVVELRQWLSLLLLEIPDSDTLVGGSGDPLVSGVELDVVNLGVGLVFNDGLVQVLDIPDLYKLVLT